MAVNAAAEIAKQRPRSKRLRRLPVHLLVKPVVDLNTGVRVLAFVAANKEDRMILAERQYQRGDMLRAEIARPRNPKFNRLVHGLGTLVRRNIEEYHDCADAHAVIKRLQRQSTAFCEEQEIDASPIVDAVITAARSILGDAAARMLEAVLPSIKRVRVLVPQSLAFDYMNEEDFHAFWRAICAYLIEHHWHTLTPEKIADLVDLLPEHEA